MDAKTFPTKGNLIAAKNSLELARQGFDLMDKKRTVLVREISELSNQAEQIQSEIASTFNNAYQALQKANIDCGLYTIKELSYTVPIDNSVKIKSRSVMGSEIPLVEIDNSPNLPSFSFQSTTLSVDEAIVSFKRVKELVVKLSQIENAAYRLSENIRKSRKRANALKNITIPKYESLVKNISESLEEKEREEFTRLKVIKKMIV